MGVVPVHNEYVWYYVQSTYAVMHNVRTGCILLQMHREMAVDWLLVNKEMEKLERNTDKKARVIWVISLCFAPTTGAKVLHTELSSVMQLRTEGLCRYCAHSACGIYYVHRSGPWLDVVCVQKTVPLNVSTRTPLLLPCTLNSLWWCIRSPYFPY